MSMARRAPRSAAFAVALLAVSAASLPAAGQPGSTAVAWSTYLRAGPAQTSAALDELEHDARVQVLGCSGRWCEVTDGELRGYVDRDALDLPRLPKPGARPVQAVVGLPQGGASVRPGASPAGGR